MSTTEQPPEVPRARAVAPACEARHRPVAATEILGKHLGERLILAASLLPGACGSATGEGPGARVVAREGATASEVLQIDSPIEFVGGGRLAEIRVEPGVARAGEVLELEFDASDVEGATIAVGLLPPRAAARQEVAYGQPGQPDDPRAVWVEHELASGRQRVAIDVPAAWSPRSAIVVAELSRRGRRLAVAHGPRSEMVRGGRAEGGRAVLALVDVHTLPVVVEAPRRARGLELDGRLREGEWPGEPAVLNEAAEGEPPEGLPHGGASELWFAYDADFLWLAARLPDVDIYSRFTERDDSLWTEEALELFIHGEANDEQYLELQVSPHNVVFDAHFPRYRKGDEGFDSAWQTAVAVDGTLDDDRDRDRAWTVEAKIPWTEICARTDARCPMAAGGELRLNVVRVERVGRERVVALSLSPLRSTDFHAWENAAILRLAR